MTERQSIEHAAGMLGVPLWRVESAVASAERRSEPDAREIYAVIDGVRLVARRANTSAAWWVSLERRPQAWERAPRTGWSG